MLFRSYRPHKALDHLTAVPALGDGILAGVLDNGKVANGLRHSFIMLLIGLVSFQLI